MKTLLLLTGLSIAFAVSFISFTNHRAGSPTYFWTQVAPPGFGSHQYEWKPGTYPNALIPIVGPDNHVWMIGQKKSWSSKDGIQWEAHDKTDWGERISMAYVFFNNTFWVSGGMDYQSNTFLNEIWSSTDGKNWKRAIDHAEWLPRKGHTLVEFKNELWLFGGAVGVDQHRSPNRYINDIWSSADGIRWTKVSDNAPWSASDYPKVVVFKGKLWTIGGQGHADIWNSDDGKNWKQVSTSAPWKDRYDYGVMVYDNLLWVYGGRESNPRNAYDDVWFSTDGSSWRQQTEHAPWTPRSAVSSMVFKNKLWLYGGKHTGSNHSWLGDIWVMEPAK